MAYPDPRQVERVALIGAGTIGGGWAAHFLRQGLDVVVYDPALADGGSERHLRQRIADVWPTLERLGLKAGAAPDRLTFAADIASAVNRVRDHFALSTLDEYEIRPLIGDGGFRTR